MPYANLPIWASGSVEAAFSHRVGLISRRLCRAYRLTVLPTCTDVLQVPQYLFGLVQQCPAVQHVIVNVSATGMTLTTKGLTPPVFHCAQHVNHNGMTND